MNAFATWLVSSLMLLAAAVAQQPQAPPPPAQSEAQKNRDPHGPPDVQRYIEGLESAARDAYQKPEEVVKALELREGDVVADLGCGPGYFTLRLARAVPKGFVFAIDVEPRQLDRLNERLKEAHVDNV